MTVCVMHLSFIFILAGALATFIAGEKGALHLRYGQEPADVFVRQDGSEARMPFAVSLEEFNVDFTLGRGLRKTTAAASVSVTGNGRR